MRAILTKDLVRTAIGKLNHQGIKPTLAAIHDILGRRGSMTTLVRLKAEIDREGPPQGDAGELVRVAVRAEDAGGKQQGPFLLGSGERLTQLTKENERLVMALAAANNRLASLENQKMVVEAKMNELQQTELQLDDAHNTMYALLRHAVSRFLAESAEHRQENREGVAKLLAELTRLGDRVHRLELGIGRANAPLEAKRVVSSDSGAEAKRRK